MILRRVIEHFKKQEWTAIAIDFIIVVAGVFIGIQVSNWNAARAEAAQEHEILAAIAEDLRADRVELQNGAASIVRSISATNYALSAIGEIGAEAFTQREGALGDIANALDLVDPDTEQRTRLWSLSVSSSYPAASVAAFDALSNTGRLDIIRDRDMRRALQIYRQNWRGLDETQAGTMRPLRNEALSIGGRYGLSILTMSAEEDFLQALRENPELRAVLQNQITYKALQYSSVIELDRDAAAILEIIESKSARL